MKQFQVQFCQPGCGDHNSHWQPSCSGGRSCPWLVHWEAESQGLDVMVVDRVHHQEKLWKLDRTSIEVNGDA